MRESHWLIAATTSRTTAWLTSSNASDDTDEITAEAPLDLYTYEADEVANCIHKGKRQSKAMGWADSLGNMEVLDHWRNPIRLTYPADQ